MKCKVLVLVATHLMCCVSFGFAQQVVLRYDDAYLANLYNRSLLFDTTRQRGLEVAAADSLNAWKKWQTVENYLYGKNRGDLPMIADLDALHPYFRDKVEELIRQCKEAGITLAIVESYRTHAKQAEYYAMGRKYTSSPGGKSRHQYGLAVDVVPMVDSVAVWDNARLWRKIGTIGERLGLRWGGRWRVLYDPGHFEWAGGVSRHELAKGLLPKIPVSRSAHYPNLEENLDRLQTYWEAWEAEQRAIAEKGADDEPGRDTAVGAGN